MIKFMKKEQGVTLITLAITIVLLVIITAAFARNSHSSMELSNLTKLQNDIQILNDRVAAYFVKNDKLPINQKVAVNSSDVMGYYSDDILTKDEVKGIINDLSPNDGDTYYVIDIEALENVTLNYGTAYKSISSKDKYIVNESTHIVYYLEGITYEGQEYHTVN